MNMYNNEGISHNISVNREGNIPNNKVGIIIDHIITVSLYVQSDVKFI